ncbi:hypothetical protein R80B4_02398 [Fibrobacteres bacterium R8-0-B4]
MNKIFITALFAAMTAASAAGGGAGTITDNRDGKTYKTAAIGGKKWMAENLNYQTPSGSWCYKNDNSNCDNYGRLYNWKTAKTACPAGFHLPYRQEWQSLVDYAGGDDAAGKKLKSNSGWNDDGGGTDDFGFSALPGGLRAVGGFNKAGSYGLWWTATKSPDGDAYYWSISYIENGADEFRYGRDFAFSVRCIED